jgi:hypothetical protein
MFGVSLAMVEIGAAAQLGALPVERALSRRLWTGGEADGAADRALLVCDLEAGAAGAGRAGVWSWSGQQITPGEGLAPQDAGGLLCVLTDIDPAQEGEFNAWYDTEHLARTGDVDGLITAHRFRAVAGEPRYLALYYLEDPGVPAGEAWRVATKTPWTKRIGGFRSNRTRLVFRPA